MSKKININGSQNGNSENSENEKNKTDSFGRFTSPAPTGKSVPRDSSANTTRPIPAIDRNRIIPNYTPDESNNFSDLFENDEDSGTLQAFLDKNAETKKRIKSANEEQNENPVSSENPDDGTVVIASIDEFNFELKETNNSAKGSDTTQVIDLGLSKSSFPVRADQLTNSVITSEKTLNIHSDRTSVQTSEYASDTGSNKTQVTTSNNTSDETSQNIPTSESNSFFLSPNSVQEHTQQEHTQQEHTQQEHTQQEYTQQEDTKGRDGATMTQFSPGLIPSKNTKDAEEHLSHQNSGISQTYPRKTGGHSISSNGSAEEKTSILAPAMVFGNQYRLITKAGTGTMGEVWQAYDSVGERTVALKFIPAGLKEYSEVVRKTKSTFQAIHDINHQYICPTHSLLEDPEFGYFLVMKWIPDTLKKMIEASSVNGKSQRFPDSTLKPLIYNLAEALDHLHSKNIIHRDLKPANIAITYKDDKSFESASLIDFGLAGKFDESEIAVQKSQICGTPRYMAPELWRNEFQGPGVDQYALAVTVYELLAGHRIFNATSKIDLVKQTLNSPPPPIPNVSPRINKALAKALAKLPEDRFPNCLAFAKAIYPPKDNYSGLKKLIIVALGLLAILVAVHVWRTVTYIAPGVYTEKLESYEFVLKSKSPELLRFALEPESKIAPTEPQIIPPPKFAKPSVSLGDTQFDPSQNQSDKTWTWTWSEEKMTGTLTLNNYRGGQIAVSGVNLNLVLPPGSNNTIDNSKADALLVEKDLTILAEARSSLALNGGLWTGGKFLFVDKTLANKAGSINAESDKAEDNSKTKVTPVLSINNQPIDYFVDTAEELQKTFLQNDRKAVILVTGSFDSTVAIKELTKNSSAFFVAERKDFTLFSSGNHIIKKGKSTSAEEPLIYIYGSLTLGDKNLHSCSTLAFDGGCSSIKPEAKAPPQKAKESTDESKTPKDVQKVKKDSLALRCLSVNGKKQYKFSSQKPLKSNKTALVFVKGTLNMHRGTIIQNNVNFCFFSTITQSVSASGISVGGLFIDEMARVSITGGVIRNCQGPLCGGINSCGELSMSGGLIEENSSYNGGYNVVEAGGVRLYNSTFTMTGGEIINNIALTNASNILEDRCAKGGGIHGSNGTAIHILGGKIRGNVSLWAGGGIYVGGNGSSSLTISQNAVISDNAAVFGGGIYSTSNVTINEGTVTDNLLLTKIFSKTPRGEGIYLKEWNKPYLQNNGPILTLSKTANINPNNPIFICSNIATGQRTGICVFIPLRVDQKLTGQNQRFIINMGSAAPNIENKIQLIQFVGKDFTVDDKSKLEDQFKKFEFGYLGFFDNTGFKLNPVKASKTEKAQFYLNLEEDNSKVKTE